MKLSRKNFLWWISGTLVSASLVTGLGCVLREESATPAEPGETGEQAEADQYSYTGSLGHIHRAHEAIVAVQLKHLEDMKNIAILDEDTINDCFRRGEYLFSVQMMPLDGAKFLEIMDEIWDVVREQDPGNPEHLFTLSAAEVFREDNLQAVLNEIPFMSKAEMKRFITVRELETKSGADSEVLSFVLFMSLSPFYSAYTQKVARVNDFSLWRQGHCPVCGQAAVMARHRSTDGARVLFCWLCHAEWLFPRLVCPYCGNNDQDKLRFFYVQDDRALQVHVCEQCKRYLKTIDNRALEKDLLLDAEEIATRHLDLLAKNEGYHRPD